MLSVTFKERTTKQRFIDKWNYLKASPRRVLSNFESFLVRLVHRLSEAWHQGDSIKYLELLVEEKERQIQDLKERLLAYEVGPTSYIQEISEEKQLPQPVIRRESWRSLKGRIAEELRQKNVNRVTESPDQV